MLESAIERASAQAEGLGRLTHVAAVALERLPDQHALHLLEWEILQPRRGPTAPEPEEEQ